MTRAMIQPPTLSHEEAAVDLGSATHDAAVIERRATLAAQIGKACSRIAPLWPLKHFVAVNPFLGLSEQRFEQACATLKRVAGTDMLMPRSFYREHIASGRIAFPDLQQALDTHAGQRVESNAPLDTEPMRVETLKRIALTDSPRTGFAAATTTTVADLLDRVRGTRWSRFVVEEISKWCAAYYDRGQASWRMPRRGQPLYTAWRAAARIDRNPEVMGLAGFCTQVASLPDDPVATIETVLTRLALPAAAIDDYLHRALLDIAGWSAYVRYLVWEKELYGGRDDSLTQLLAIRLAWDGALHALHRDAAFRDAWSTAVASMSDARTAGAARDADLEIDTLLQQAFEFAYQRRLLAKLTTHNARRSAADAAAGRKAVQAAFCIDVRSEVFRRSLETVTPEVETIGFAGFFGFPIEYIPIGYSHGGAQCPVLLTPTFRVREALLGATPAEESRVIAQRTLRRRVRSAWKSFRTSAISCFSYVETAGLLFAFKLFTDSFGLTRTVTHPSAEGLDADVLRRLGPQIERHLHHHAHHGHDAHAAQSTGFAPDERVAMAEAVLRAMSMTGNFARLVLLAGHGSTTINNPHATSLDCGACGGHTGEANARVAAAILNDSAVRAGLAARGIMVPADAWFLAGLHDTTTDDVRIYDADKVPATLASDLERLRRWLAQAKQLTHVQRATLLGIGNRSQAGIDANIEQRSRDWSQVRPEWGLAGNAAFIAAPRSRTQGRDLGGRAFLHNYDWRADSNWSVLELIMTAPMVVASWINLQYYGSTVNNAVFGSGNKVLHNVVGGTLGVLQGNGGDLQVGLPLQSVHDGKRFVHEPLRLNVFIEAPQDAIDGVIARHQSVRQLLDNGWIHLFRIADGGRHHHRYLGKLQWEAVR